MLSFLAGMAYGNAGEWIMHKYVLHELGRKRESFWSGGRGGGVKMADVHDKATRSYNMSRIRGKDTKPELIVRKFLSAKGYRYRLNHPKLPGKPDIVLPKYKTVIFVHGCFWHGHKNCKYFVLPKTRPKWWQAKIEGTKKRDKRNVWLLRKLGWKVVTIYECGLKATKKDLTLGKLLKHVT